MSKLFSYQVYVVWNIWYQPQRERCSGEQKHASGCSRASEPGQGQWLVLATAWPSADAAAGPGPRWEGSPWRQAGVSVRRGSSRPRAGQRTMPWGEKQFPGQGYETQLPTDLSTRFSPQPAVSLLCPLGSETSLRQPCPRCQAPARSSREDLAQRSGLIERFPSTFTVNGKFD